VHATPVDSVSATPVDSVDVTPVDSVSATNHADSPLPDTDEQPRHPLLQAVGPLVDRIGAAVVDPVDLRTDDVPLEWEGEIVGGIRLPPGALGSTKAPSRIEEEVGGGLEGIIVDIERFFGTPLAELPRARKQQAVRMFEEGGAFSYRKSVEAVAAALGISRFTVYNYLNRDRA